MLCYIKSAIKRKPTFISVLNKIGQNLVKFLSFFNQNLSEKSKKRLD